ncbi:MAG TPA: endonuclease III domain-containing protein [Candidatus Methylomirabilis sp.]
MRQRLLRLYDLMFRAYGPQHWWPARTRFEVVVGAVLTQNTAWTNVEKAIARLRAAGALRPAALAALPRQRLAALIRSAGYYNIKAERLQNLLRYLRRRCGLHLPRLFRGAPQALRRELLAVNGIGPETADSILLYAGNIPIFVVDAYTRRILARHGLLRPDAGYGETQALFTAHLPPDVALFNEYHALLVMVGKDHCRSVPRCETCPLRADLPPGGPRPLAQRAAGRGPGTPKRGVGTGGRRPAPRSRPRA